MFFFSFENLLVDEMVIGYKGSFHAKQFNDTKPHEYHIKSFGVCDSRTGFVCDLLIYFGTYIGYNPDDILDFNNLLADIRPNHNIFAEIL